MKNLHCNDRHQQSNLDLSTQASKFIPEETNLNEWKIAGIYSIK